MCRAGGRIGPVWETLVQFNEGKQTLQSCGLEGTQFYSLEFSLIYLVFTLKTSFFENTGLGKS